MDIVSLSEINQFKSEYPDSVQIQAHYLISKLNQSIRLAYLNGFSGIREEISDFTSSKAIGQVYDLYKEEGFQIEVEAGSCAMLSPTVIKIKW